jgi:hypothetical protein
MLANLCNALEASVLIQFVKLQLFPEYMIFCMKSHNRDPYYDYWALRYSGYDLNIKLDGGGNLLHKEFSETISTKISCVLSFCL